MTAPLIERKAAGEESNGGEQQDVFASLRPDAISGCLAAGGCRAQVAQMPQTQTQTQTGKKKLCAFSHTTPSKDPGYRKTIENIYLNNKM